MKFLLASMMVKQETCEKKIKLLNSCQVYPESDRIPDLFIRNSRTFSMFDD